MRNKNNTHRGFTLAEMMMVMLILTIILAAFAPLMTKRKTVDLSSPWRWASNNSDIYYGTGNNQTAMIGQKAKVNTDPNARLLINSSNGVNNPHITFKEGNNIKGHLLFKGNSIFLGSATDDSGNSIIPPLHDDYNIAIGINALKQGSKSRYNIAIGDNVLSGNLSDSGNSGGNIAIGVRAVNPYPYVLGNFTQGQGNVVLGSHLAGDEATLGRVTNSAVNIAIGSGVLKNLQVGANNIAIGTHACEGLYDTNNKICIGANSGPNQGIGDHDMSHQIWLGNRSVDDITVYIGAKPLKQIIKNEANSSSSDKRLKNISGENKYGLDVIRNLKTYNFTFKDDKKKTPHAGIIAQDLQKYIPDAIEKDEKGDLAVRLDFVRTTMLNAIKQLDVTVQKISSQVKDVVARVTNLETQIKALQKENKELKAKVNSLEKQNKAFETRLKNIESKL